MKNKRIVLILRQNGTNIPAINDKKYDPYRIADGLSHTQANALAPVQTKTAAIRVLSDATMDFTGLLDQEAPATLLDVTIEPGQTFALKTSKSEASYVYSMEGNVSVGSTELPALCAALLDDGDCLVLRAGQAPSRCLFLSETAKQRDLHFEDALLQYA
ncbi:hypothetical protein LJC27_02735 [Christensenellaceae bacterium OttesenSCG-928-M15]|nr:hypothetical protein [Christensenellaceae bacterium OttesenSCG-928-M15]